ncbi:MAG: hypothetical protein NC117_02745 [Pseudoflavonifractor sp.]|nr:hypothetical protein [Pseudoflavonifractor sp.]
MADIEKIVPFIIQHEAGVNPAGLTGERLFEKARRTGYSDDPDDRGGATMAGVTLATYTDYCRRHGYPRPSAVDHYNIPYARWLDILRTMYWDRWRADGIVSQSVALMLVDWVWLSGAHGITIPQRMLGVTADGVVGPVTLAAVNAQPPAAFFDRLKAERTAFIDRICASRPANTKYRKGWLNRLNSIRFQS